MSPQQSFDKSLESLSWEQLSEIIRASARVIQADGKPDLLLPISRGGLVPAVLLSHLLQVRELTPILATRTTGDQPLATKQDVDVAYMPPKHCLRKRDALIVDDVIGSGETLTTIHGLVKEAQPTRLRSFVCARNTRTLHGHNWNQIRPFVNHVGYEVDGWIIFPWELENVD